MGKMDLKEDGWDMDWIDLAQGNARILINVHSQYVTKETLEKFGDFKIGQVICTVIYGGDPVLLANEERVI